MKEYLDRGAGKDLAKAYTVFARYLAIAIGAYCISLIGLLGSVIHGDIETKIVMLDALKDAGWSFCLVMISFGCAQMLSDILERSAPQIFKYIWFFSVYISVLVAGAYAIASFNSLTSGLNDRFQTQLAENQ